MLHYLKVDATGGRLGLSSWIIYKNGVKLLSYVVSTWVLDLYKVTSVVDSAFVIT
jgi:hypothetical protein